MIADGGADNMSEPKYWLVGKVSVPEEKKEELNSAVLEVLKLCGIRKKRKSPLPGNPSLCWKGQQ